MNDYAYEKGTQQTGDSQKAGISVFLCTIHLHLKYKYLHF